MHKFIRLLAAMAIILLWALKGYFVDIPALNLGYQAIFDSRHIEPYRIVRLRVLNTTSGKEVHIRMLPVHDSGNPIKDVLTRYSLPLTGKSWNGLHPGLVLPTIPFNGQRVLLVTAVLNSAFFQVIFSSLPDSMAIPFLASLLLKSGIVKQNRNNGWGSLSFIIVFILPLFIFVGQAFFMAAVGSGWITGVKKCATEATLSAGIACALLPVALIAIFNLPPLTVVRIHSDGPLEGP